MSNREKELTDALRAGVTKHLGITENSEPYTLEDALEKKLSEVSVPKKRRGNDRHYDPRELAYSLEEDVKSDLKDLGSWNDAEW